MTRRYFNGASLTPASRRGEVALAARWLNLPGIQITAEGARAVARRSIYGLTALLYIAFAGMGVR